VVAPKPMSAWRWALRWLQERVHVALTQGVVDLVNLSHPKFEILECD
jgi:hypothetical protein